MPLNPGISAIVDSSLLIALLRGRDQVDTVLERLSLTGPIAIVTLTYFELLQGARTQRAVEASLDLLSRFQSIPVDRDLSIRAGRLSANLRAAGVTIDTADYFIAQAAMDHSVPLLTLNTRHFTLVPGLLVVNP